TAVLYVVQRLESLSHTFVFLGLWLYLRARMKLATEGRGTLRMWLALVGATLAGLLVKESAVLLPLYAACVESALFPTASARTVRSRITTLYACLLLVPLLVGMAWLASWIGTEASYPREFGTLQRLMTEARVLV